MIWAPFSSKALVSLANCDAFINIFEGAVRSSKTVVSTVAWLTFIEESEHTEFLMTGKTADTLFRNVIGGSYGVLAIMGKRATYVKSSQGGAKLTLKFGGKKKICYCLGANDERAEGNLRGMTIAGWYADELTLYPESFVKQAINRMSLEGAQAFWTMNPDSPFHYIKLEFIDKAKEKGYRLFHYELGDNLSLSQRYKDELKKAYTGLWFKRMVLGLWVMAEGSIYDMWDDSKHIIHEIPPGLNRNGVSIDYGTTNPCTFGLYEWREGTRKITLTREYYYDSKALNIQKTDQEYADAFATWLNGLWPEVVYVDPSAASFIAELKKRGYPVRNANNDVLDGIRFTAGMITGGNFNVMNTCKGTIQEFPSYIWDPKAQVLGLDKPLKQNDHAMDRNRYFLYSHFRRVTAGGFTDVKGGKR